MQGLKGSHSRALAVGLIFAALSHAGPVLARHHGPNTPDYTAPSNGPSNSEPAPLAAEVLPKVDAAAAPSASLLPFLNAHLDKFLTPLGTAACTQVDLIDALKSVYNGALPAADELHKSAYLMAISVCDGLVEAINARKQAVDMLATAYQNRTSEAVQPRGGKQAVKDADKDEAFFYESAKSNWKLKAAELRQHVLLLYARVQVAEKRVGVWATPPHQPATTPAPTVVSGVPSPVAAVTPSVSVPAPETDPVQGNWWWEGHMPMKLDADHRVSGAREGTWASTSTTALGRNYEVHWKKKGAVDYVILTADGKTLDGRNKDGKHVSANH